MESSGRAVSKTVPGFEFRATFEGDIEGFRLLIVLVAATVFWMYLCFSEMHITIALILLMSLNYAIQTQETCKQIEVIFNFTLKQIFLSKKNV